MASKYDTPEGAVRIPPLFNSLFLRLFGREDSKPLTQKLLNAVLELAALPTVAEIDGISADSAIPGGLECRTARCDVVLVSGDSIYDLESQGWHADVANKSLFYGAKLLADRTGPGSDDSYFEMSRVVVVTLLHGRTLFPDDPRIVSVGTLRWGSAGDNPPTTSLATDRMALILVEMEKISERYNIGSREVLSEEPLAWLYLLAKGYRNPQEVEAIMSAFPTMEQFAAKYGIAIGDPDLKRQYDLMVESTLEYNTMKREAQMEGHAQGHAEGLAEGRAEGLAEGRAEGLAEGRAEGRAEGLEEGLEEGRKERENEIASKLRALGIDEEVIHEALE